MDGSPGGRLGRYCSKLRDPVDAASHATDRAVDIEVEVAIGDADPVTLKVGGVEHGRLPAHDAGRAQDQTRAGPLGGVEQRGVFVRRARIRKFDVVGDNARAGAQQVVDDAGMQRARQHRGVHALEVRVVEPDDLHLLRLALGTAEREPLVDRGQLEVEHARRPDRDGDACRQQPDGEREGPRGAPGRRRHMGRNRKVDAGVL
jgi:hypothetical protein